MGLPDWMIWVIANAEYIVLVGVFFGLCVAGIAARWVWRSLHDKGRGTGTSGDSSKS